MKTQNYVDVRGSLPAVPPPAAETYVVHKHQQPEKRPRLSLILLDWSCRERFDTLDWLQRQDVSSDDYELLWIELHDRVVPDALAKADLVITCHQGRPYHKHLGYNIGLLHARGELICVCDSDAVFPRDFVSSVFRSFYPHGAADPIPLVLMHHELRTSFTYPEGLADAEDLKNQDKWKWWPLVPNAGACMTVRRADAIRFGGFDEDESFRGYLCGPYDLGWRLVNAGLPEIWHHTDCVLWHFAHPDPVGANGFAPQLRLLRENAYPHVDMHALTAVEAFSSGRFQPRKENRRIFDLRMADRRIGTPFEEKYSAMLGPAGFPKMLVARMHLAMVADIYFTALWGLVTGSVRVGLRRLLGEKSYLRWRNVFFHRLRWVLPASGDGVIKEYRGFNLLQHNGTILGLPQILGAIDPNDESQLSHPAIARGPSVREVKRIIDREDLLSWVAVSVERCDGYNILRWRYRFYAVPEAGGPVDLCRAEHREQPGILSSDSLEAVLAQVQDMREVGCARHG